MMSILCYIFSFLFFVEITFEGADFKDVIEKYVLTKGKYKNENISIDYLNLPEKVTVNSSNAQLAVSNVSTDLLSGNVTIPVNIMADKKILKRIFVSVKIHVYDSVFVTKKSINQFQIFNSDNIEKKWQEISGFEQQVVRHESEINEKRAIRYISEGKLITLNIIENLPIIKSGQTITIISKVNSVVVTATGTAKEDGKKGEIISIENNSSGAKLKGRVVDNGKVEIIR
jgi:flagellar basal body P-ring formation protein FlgA